MQWVYTCLFKFYLLLVYLLLVNVLNYVLVVFSANDEILLKANSKFYASCTH